MSANYPSSIRNIWSRNIPPNVKYITNICSILSSMIFYFVLSELRAKYPHLHHQHTYKKNVIHAHVPPHSVMLHNMYFVLFNSSNYFVAYATWFCWSQHVVLLLLALKTCVSQMFKICVHQYVYHAHHVKNSRAKFAISRVTLQSLAECVN